MDDFTGISENDVDVEAIMRKVREKMDKGSPVRQPPADIPAENGMPDQLRSDLKYLRSIASVDNSQYTISSHRKLVGPALVKGRQLINGEVRRYVDPMAARQSEFNVSAARAIEDLSREMARNSRGLDSRIDDCNSAVRESDFRARSDIEKTRSEMAGIIDKKFEDTLSLIDEDIENKAWLAGVLEKRIGDSAGQAWEGPAKRDDPGVDYLDFENTFRGHVRDIKQRQSFFIGYFRHCESVLDIGCGRGEFLELLKESGIRARGIDLDDGMVSYCTGRGLDVRKADALSFLENEDGDFFDGIFMDQVIEHMDPPYLIKLLTLCHRKLKPGGVILMETVNPTSLTSFANFYIDLTHVRPVHPYTLKYLAESAGFGEVEIQFISPVAEESRLKKISIGTDAKESEKAAFETYNTNVDRLNDVLFGAQDYALIARK